MWWRRERTEVAEFLYGLLLTHADKGYAREVADRMGVPYPTLAKYWSGKRRFPAVLVKSLFLATDQDPRVAEFFLLEGSDYRLERTEPAPQNADSVPLVMELAALSGELSRLFLKGEVDRSKVDTVLDAIATQARALQASNRV